MKSQEYYLSQTNITCPGEYAFMFDDLPDDMEKLCAVVRGMHIHFRDLKAPRARKREADLRTVSAILERAYTLDNRPLPVRRRQKQRVMGCCRDAAVLLCSMLRHKGIPARIRVGFAPYFLISSKSGENFSSDHVITEYWDGSRWRLVDTGRFDWMLFDTLDVPRDHFLVGGYVWQMCRKGEMNPEMFGHGPGDDFTGWWALRDILIRDLAAQNKVELLLWDAWGWMFPDFHPNEEELAFLDQIAELTQAEDATFDQVRTLYANNECVRAPSTVICHSPFLEPFPINWQDSAHSA